MKECKRTPSDGDRLKVSARATGVRPLMSVQLLSGPPMLLQGRGRTVFWYPCIVFTGPNRPMSCRFAPLPSRSLFLFNRQNFRLKLKNPAAQLLIIFFFFFTTSHTNAALFGTVRGLIGLREARLGKTSARLLTKVKPHNARGDFRSAS